MTLYEFYCLLQNECVNVNLWLWRFKWTVRGLHIHRWKSGLPCWQNADNTLVLWKCGCLWGLLTSHQTRSRDPSLRFAVTLWVGCFFPSDFCLAPQPFQLCLHEYLYHFMYLNSPQLSLGFSVHYSCLYIIFPHMELSISHLLKRLKFPSACTFSLPHLLSPRTCQFCLHDFFRPVSWLPVLHYVFFLLH